jgi:SIR2-like domain
MPTATSMTLEQALDLLDGSFNEFATAVTQDRYAFWLGSGISRERVPPLRGVAIKVIAYLQSRISLHDPNCRFGVTLEEVLRLVGFSDEDRRRNDIRQPIASWPDRDNIADRLTLQYSRMLDVPVLGEGPDFLLWEAVDVVRTYADPTLEPDSEHLCLAGLIAEGVASTIVSANWDGLIEKALLQLTGTVASMNVCVRPEETRRVPSRSILYKPHGCAVLAGENAGLYRAMLVARKSQIDRFITDIGNPIVQRLIDIATSKQSLIVGLSVQDGNLQGIFATAQQRMHWPFPSQPPAIIIAGSEIGPDQESLLQNVYLAQYSGATRQAIQQSSIFTAYAKLFFLSLFVHVLSAKLTALMEIAVCGWAAVSRDQLRTGVRLLQTKLAQSGLSGDYRNLTSMVLGYCARTLCLFREGSEPNAGSPSYRAITNTPAHQLVQDPMLPATGLPGLGLAFALLGLGESRGHWEIHEPDMADLRPGVLRITASGSTAQVFLASDAESVSNLIGEGLLDSTDPAILIHSRRMEPPMARSPKGVYGRSGGPTMREISLGALLGASADVDELLERFREEVAA